MGRCIIENHGFLRAYSIANYRLRQRGHYVDAVSQLHDHILSTSDGFPVDPQLFASRCNQETSLRAGVFERRAHEPVDQLLQNHLARECLRGPNHRCEIEMLDWRFDRARWPRRALILAQPRIQLIELPYLSVGAPSQIAPPRVSQVEMCDFVEATRGVKAGAQLVCERLILDEAVCACRRDGALVQVHGLERASLDAGNLSAHKGDAILEVFPAVLRPYGKLSLVSG